MIPIADLIITNGQVFTSDVDDTQAEAVAIRGNRILYVGTNQEALGFKGNSTRLTDAAGCTVTPGFIDSHFHLLWGAVELRSAQLHNVKTRAEVESILKIYSNQNLTSEWIDGHGVKYGIISGRRELDQIVSNRPVFINAYDGHTAWANTMALERAGILQPGTEASGIGVIMRDKDGLATGELRETAMDLVGDIIPVPNEARKRELLKVAIQQINAAGVTSVHNMNGDLQELLTYAALEDAGGMTLRVYTPFLVRPQTKQDDLIEAVEMARIQGEFARGGAVKFFMDGVWESYTALTLEPYADNPDAKPQGIYSAEHFTRMASACDKLGLQIFAHCCGDGAVRRVLDGYGAVQKLNGRRDSRHRIEHIEVIHPDDLPRFRQLGVLASMQTSHAPISLAEEDVWTSRVGEKRWPHSFAWREIKNAGAHLALGSDWTVASFDPMINMHSALNREKWSPADPDQRLTLEEVIIGYTRDAAYAEFMEHEKGQIREGYLADLVIFSHDLFKMNPLDIKSARAVTTIVDGKIVHALGDGEA